MMSTAASPPLAPIALQHDDGEPLWFLGSLARVKASGESTEGRVAVVEFQSPRGTGSPLHVHRNEDEWFYVTNGQLTFWVADTVIDAPVGTFVYGPRDVPHTYEVASEEASFLLVAQPAGFEAFMREVGEPAKTLSIPPPASDPPDFQRLAAVAAEYGIEVLGPPGIPT
jgi:quercetin dioxygenase-like cupin family protein